MTAIPTFSAAAHSAHDRMPDELNEHERPQAAESSAHADRKETNVSDDAGNAGGAGASTLASTAASILSDRKTHLAIGVAATLGLMVFYSWREKNLAKTDPEEYARIQRIKASVRNTDKDRPHAGAPKSGQPSDSGKDEPEA